MIWICLFNCRSGHNGSRHKVCDIFIDLINLEPLLHAHTKSRDVDEDSDKNLNF